MILDNEICVEDLIRTFMDYRRINYRAILIEKVRVGHDISGNIKIH